MPDTRTRLPISGPVRDKLRRQKTGGDTYDDVILRLINENGENDHDSVGDNGGQGGL